MFEQATLTAVPAASRLWTTCAGVTGQALIVGSMLLAPLISPAVLPQLQSYVTLTAPGPPPPPPPPPGEITVRPRSARTIPFQVTKGLVLPRFIPDRAATIEEPPEIGDPGGRGGVPGGVAGGVDNGVVGGVLTAGVLVPPPPPPKPVATPAKTDAPAVIPRLRPGGNVKLASPIRRVEPEYPPIARQAHIEGVVQLEGVIGTDGRIHELRVLGGHPFLVKAAVDAVKQWVYTPTLLNGDPIEVIAPITVTFRLGGR